MILMNKKIFNIVITDFKTCRRQISTLNIKYYKSPFKKVRARKSDIMITMLSKSKSDEPNNEYYNLENIFKKFIL